MGSLDIMYINSNKELEAFPRRSTEKGLVVEQGISKEEKQRVKS